MMEVPQMEVDQVHEGALVCKSPSTIERVRQVLVRIQNGKSFCSVFIDFISVSKLSGI